MAEVKSAKKAKKDAPLTDTGDVQRVTDFLIKPESSIPKLDTSKWPLLLKVRADNIRHSRGHFVSLLQRCTMRLPRSISSAFPPHLPSLDFPAARHGTVTHAQQALINRCFSC